MQYTDLSWRGDQPYSEIYDDIYYSSTDDECISGESEFNHVFFRHNGLPERWRPGKNFVIAELGFGSGINCLLTISKWLSHCNSTGQHAVLHYIAIEKHPLSPESLSKILSRYPALQPLVDELIDNYPPAVSVTHIRHLFDNRVTIHYKFMDVSEALDDELLNIDAWYLDGFSPAKNADMWSLHLFEKIVQNSNQGASCSTYTAAGFVRRNLLAAGFDVQKVAGFGAKRDMLTARLPAPEAGTQQEGERRFEYSEKPWFNTAAETGRAVSGATVLGSGIAGLTTAYALIRRGYTVTIIDDHNVKAVAGSSNLASIVYPRLSAGNPVDTDFYVTAFCYTAYMLNKLQHDHDQRFWFDSGLVQQFSGGRLDAILQRYDFNSDFLSVVDEVLSKTGKSDDLSFACFKMSGVVLPRVLEVAIKQACGDSLEFIDKKVSRVTKESGHWCCYHDTKKIDESDVLVLANGCGINDIGLDINLDLKMPIESVRGQMLELETNERAGVVDEAVNAEVYITPPVRGKHYLGSTYARDNTSVECDFADTEKLLDSVNRMYPGKFDQQDCTDTWVGFRAVAEDRVPVVGAIPDVSFFKREYDDICHGRMNRRYPGAKHQDGLYATVAHGSHGFTSSFLSAEIIASLISGEQAPVSKPVLDLISPSRFIVNDLKRG